LLRHGAKIQADPEFNPAFSEIVDLGAVTSLAVSDSYMRPVHQLMADN
jgi:hypothetical protein